MMRCVDPVKSDVRAAEQFLPLFSQNDNLIELKIIFLEI